MKTLYAESQNTRHNAVFTVHLNYQALLPTSFSSQSRLHELHMEENRLRDLSHFQSLLNLERLYLGMNRIQVCNVCLTSDT